MTKFSGAHCGESVNPVALFRRAGQPVDSGLIRTGALPIDVLQDSLPLSITVFAVCVAIVATAGVKITAVVDELADRTRVGEALAGAVLLGATTSLSGSVLSVTAALKGNADLALSNALGGIAVQTAFLAVADLFYRRANLEHAAASAANLMQGALLVTLMAVILVGAFSPPVTVFGIHPATPLLFGAYIYGLRLIQSTRDQPMWQPARTRETREDVPEEENLRRSLRTLLIAFLGLGALLGVTGWALENAAAAIASQTGLAQTTMGLLLTATVTSLPELVTSVAAVRRGALTLAVGGIIGGNAFDTLFTAASDIAYQDGSIYAEMGDDLLVWVSLSILMTGALLMGLIRREEQGPGGIGFESVAVLLLYGLGILLVVHGG
ncbi:sodium:calcium antiporter [Alloalcanivorax profundimaris]|uniref:sodium:calcium antiporter n=1 Tax=Alloalcanivorax profundimaris TaxID=2735259 RepID=UPI00188857BB|nr:sodium:calcium antiporter [Alloalcanivorax profundimaris]MBF1801252.1 sodium:calcium antiporter [Alloalcanivorax profundimaris]